MANANGKILKTNTTPFTSSSPSHIFTFLTSSRHNKQRRCQPLWPLTLHVFVQRQFRRRRNFCLLRSSQQLRRLHRDNSGLVPSMSTSIIYEFLSRGFTFLQWFQTVAGFFPSTPKREHHRLQENAASGMAVHDDCKLRFMELKAKRTHGFIIYKIEEAQKQVIVEKLGEPSQGYEDFASCLPVDESHYVVYDFEFTTEGNVPKSRICFIAW